MQWTRSDKCLGFFKVIYSPYIRFLPFDHLYASPNPHSIFALYEYPSTTVWFLLVYMATKILFYSVYSFSFYLQIFWTLWTCSWPGERNNKVTNKHKGCTLVPHTTGLFRKLSSFCYLALFLFKADRWASLQAPFLLETNWPRLILFHYFNSSCNMTNSVSFLTFDPNNYI